MAGNDGTMDATKQKLKTVNARSKTDSTTKDSVPKQDGRKRSVRQDGAELLRQAVDRRVGEDSEQLADVIAKKAMKGDLAAVKVMVGLADSKKPVQEPVQKRRGLSQAQRLAEEPQWQGTREKPGTGISN